MSIITPYKNSENKKKQVQEMFNNISEKYDFLNRFLSLGMDQLWRKKAINQIKNNPDNILDIATGTADFAIIAAKYTKAKITGIDISQGMLKIGEKNKKSKTLESIDSI